MYVSVCVCVWQSARESRRRASTSAFTNKQDTMLTRAAAAASQLRHEPNQRQCARVKRERARRIQNKQQSSLRSFGHYALALSRCCCCFCLCSALPCALPRSALSIVFAFNFNGCRALCFQSFFVFCLPFFSAACFAHVVAVPLTRALSHSICTLSCARSLELFLGPFAVFACRVS